MRRRGGSWRGAGTRARHSSGPSTPGSKGRWRAKGRMRALGKRAGGRHPMAGAEHAKPGRAGARPSRRVGAPYHGRGQDAGHGRGRRPRRPAFPEGVPVCVALKGARHGRREGRHSLRPSGWIAPGERETATLAPIFHGNQGSVLLAAPAAAETDPRRAAIHRARTHHAARRAAIAEPAAPRDGFQARYGFK